MFNKTHPQSITDYRGGEKTIKKEDFALIEKRLRALESRLANSHSKYTSNIILGQLVERLYTNDLKWYKAYQMCLEYSGTSYDLNNVFNPNITSPFTQSSVNLPVFDYLERTDKIIYFRNPLYFKGSIGDRVWLVYVPNLQGYYLLNVQCVGYDKDTDPDPYPPE